uniref:UV excision repair protein RAD23 n=1 Tax=Tetranychus urticae TaxID=32264 RepID=T1KYQ6_TETUR
MLVTVRTLNQQTFKIEIDPEEKVSDLKKKIEETKGPTFAVANQKLIYAGKILSDENKISECNIEEAKYVVVMVLQPKTEQTSSASPSAPSKPISTPTTGATGSSSASTATTTGSSIETSKASAKKESSGKEETATTPSAESNLVLGDQFEDMVKNIMEMGYDRNQVEKALRASFNNPERAVEYLINGLPLDAVADETAPPVSEGETGGSTTPTTGGRIVSADPSNPLAFLRSQPMFLQMRQIIQQDPLALYNLMQQIRETNPQLYELINRNQENFVQMLNEPDMAGQATGPISNPASLGGSNTGGTGGGGGASGFPSGIENLIGTAHITQADKEAIERNLIELFFLFNFFLHSACMLEFERG